MSEKKEKEKPETPEDLSTPDPIDEVLVRWAQRCFRGDEQAAYFFVTQQFRNRSGGVTVGDVVRKWPVAHCKGDAGVKLDQLIIACNEMIEEMQDEADTLRQTRWFLVTAHNSLKGGEFSRKSVEREPSAKIRLNGKNGAHDGDGEFDPVGGDLLRKRAETVLQDGRFYAEHVAQASGDVIRLLAEQLKISIAQVNELFRSNMEYAKLLNEAENNKLDRDLIRAERELILTAKRKGIGLLAGLLPDFLKKVTNGKVEVPGGRTAESMALEAVMDESAGGLTVEEKHKIFGDWTDQGERLAPGILTETQVRIIVDVLNQKVDPSALDQLITDGSDEQLTTPQYTEIMRVLGGDMDKLMPLVKILKDRKALLDRASAEASKQAS